MIVPRRDLPPLDHELRLMLRSQGPGACRMVLETEVIGSRLREHATCCADCGDVMGELYGNREIAVRDELL
jgi:hypothetical protein